MAYTASVEVAAVASYLAVHASFAAAAVAFVVPVPFVVAVDNPDSYSSAVAVVAVDAVALLDPSFDLDHHNSCFADACNFVVPALASVACVRPAVAAGTCPYFGS